MINPWWEKDICLFKSAYTCLSGSLALVMGICKENAKKGKELLKTNFPHITIV